MILSGGLYIDPVTDKFKHVYLPNFPFKKSQILYRDRGTVLLWKRAFRVDNINTSICENRELLESRSGGTL